MVLQRAAKKTLPGVTRAGLLAAALLRSRVAKLLAAASRAAPRQLENVPDAAERPACRDDQGGPLVPAGGVEERWPRGPEPRGPLRGGPGRSSDDPRLSKTTQRRDKREAKGKKGAKWPIVVTVNKSGEEKKWGPLSRNMAWKAGCFWEESKGAAMVFLEKSGEKKEVSVEKLVGKDGPRFWFKDKKPDTPKEQAEERQDDQTVTEEAADESTTEDATQVMSEIHPGDGNWKKDVAVGEGHIAREGEWRTEEGPPGNGGQD